MTNQASEDDVRRQINKIFDETRIDYEGVYEPRAEELLIDLLRTEKLKLLAEVRERVVTIPVHGGTDSYYASKNIKAVPISELDKLEAEL